MLDHDALAQLREHHPAWRLLRAQHAPLVLSVLGEVFVDDNVRSLPLSELVTRVDDQLYALRQIQGEEAYPQEPTAYVTDWVSAGWLRMYYPPGTDDPHVDATPALERAVAWVEGLQERAFVGTESRLATLVDLLRQIVHGGDTDPQRRLDRLLEQRDELDRRIARAREGHVDVLDDTAQRERYQQFVTSARELLSDFREVETKFRGLDRQMRETIAAWDGSKGELLDQILGDRNLITDSDQGRSFAAFHDFLLSAQRQDELADLLAQVQTLPALRPEPRVARVDQDWLVAADRTQATVRALSDQLRRFLDDRVWLENRRVMDLLRSIETSAVALRGVRDTAAPGSELDALSASIRLPVDRPLYQRPPESRLESTVDEAQEVADPDALFAVQYVDRALLAERVRSALTTRDQVELTTLLDEHPAEQGLAEVVGYLAMVEDGVQTVFDEEARTRATWENADGDPVQADLPTVLFIRDKTGGVA